MCFFTMHIRKSAIRSFRSCYFCAGWGLGGGFLQPRQVRVSGVSPALWFWAPAQPAGLSPCFLHCPRMAPGPERSNGQGLSPFHILPQKTPLVTKGMQDPTTDPLNVKLNCMPSRRPLAGLLGVPACPSLGENSVEGRAVRRLLLCLGNPGMHFARGRLSLNGS